MHTSTRDGRDDCGNVIASILVSKAAVATFNLAPFLIGGYIDRLGLSAAQASRVLSVEILALAISNAVGFLWLRRVDPRALAQRLLLALIAVNLSCIFAGGYATLLLQRATVGAIEGALLAIGFGLLGLTRRPERNFGFYFAVSLTIGAINVRILPLFLDTAGVAGLFTNLSLYALIALAGSFWLERRSPAQQAQAAPAEGTATLPIGLTMSAVQLTALLAANYIYFVGQGGVWSFFERLGQQNSLPLVSIANAISLSLMAGVAGGLAASWLDVKLGRVLPLVAAIIIACLSLGILWNAPDTLAFAAAAVLFNFANNFGHPYILGMAAKADGSGRLTVLSGALHTGGQATGPFIVGLLVAPPDFTSALSVGFVMFGVTLLLLAPVARLNRPKAPRPVNSAALP